MALQLRLSTRESFFGVRLLDYAAAYRTGYEGFHNYPGKPYEEIESDLALNYDRNKAGSALPWDHARHAVRAAWAKLSHDNIGPRDPDQRNPQRDLIIVAAVYEPSGEKSMWRSASAATTAGKRGEFRHLRQRKLLCRFCRRSRGIRGLLQRQSALLPESDNHRRRN